MGLTVAGEPAEGAQCKNLCLDLRKFGEFYVVKTLTTVLKTGDSFLSSYAQLDLNYNFCLETVTFYNY